MNDHPAEHFRCPADRLEAFIASAGRKVGMPDDKAAVLASLLTVNDLRGVFSHGTQQMLNYAGLMRDRDLNADPRVRTVRETASSALVDGDGGLGYFAAIVGAETVIAKAMDQGIAAAVTRNHGHIGAAGIYSRMGLANDLMMFVTSGHQLSLGPGKPLHAAAGGSPMSFSAPAGKEPPLVMDCGVMHDLYGGGHRDQIARLAPGLVLRGIGFGEICQSWGGLLSGLSVEPPSDRLFPGAYQGAMIVAIRVDLFADVAVFKREMDEYIQRIRQLKPIEGFDQAYAAGSIEHEREREYSQAGIPIGRDHQELLDRLAEELAIPAPWGAGSEAPT